MILSPSLAADRKVVHGQMRKQQWSGCLTMHICAESEDVILSPTQAKDYSVHPPKTSLKSPRSWAKLSISRWLPPADPFHKHSGRTPWSSSLPPHPWTQGKGALLPTHHPTALPHGSSPPAASGGLWEVCMPGWLASCTSEGRAAPLGHMSPPLPEDAMALCLPTLGSQKKSLSRSPLTSSQGTWRARGSGG